MLSSISNSKGLSRQTPKSQLIGFAVGMLMTALLLVVASETLVRRHVLPQDTLGLHLSLLATALADGAAFGDSHVARGFAPPEGLVNLAYPSENITDMLNKARSYYSERAPGLVIVQADPHQFSPYRVLAEPQDYDAMDGTGLSIGMPRHRWRLLGYWDAFLKGQGQLVSQVQMTETGALLSAGDFSALPERRQIFEARLRLVTHAPATDEKVAEAKQTYEELLDFLDENGAQICLVTFPVSEAYGDAEDGLHDDLIAFFASEARRVRGTYVDARRVVENPKMFRDADHLNAEGALSVSPHLFDLCNRNPV